MKRSCLLLITHGHLLNTIIKLLQGPNSIKEFAESLIEDRVGRPFCALIESHRSGNVARVVKSGTVEFPLTARVEDY